MRRWLAPVLIAGMVVFSLAIYSSLPERVPTHWNVRGEVDGYSARAFGAFLMPGIALVLWVLLPVLRRIDPRQQQYEHFDKTFWLLVTLMVVFMAGMHVLTLSAALGWITDVTRTILVMLGLMFVMLGNYLPRVRSNWWMGIRTPWTLENDRVWRSTHRVAGTTFVVGGLITIVSVVLPPSLRFTVAMTGLMLGALIPVVYSYVAYRRERGRAGA